MKTSNLLGAQGAISKADLQQLHSQLNQSRQEILKLSADWNTKEMTLKSIVAREENRRLEVEQRLTESEFLV